MSAPLKLDPLPHFLIATGTPPASPHAVAEATEYLIHTQNPRIIFEIYDDESCDLGFRIIPHTNLDPPASINQAKTIALKAEQWYLNYLKSSTNLDLS